MLGNTNDNKPKEAASHKIHQKYYPRLTHRSDLCTETENCPSVSRHHITPKLSGTEILKGGLSPTRGAMFWSATVLGLSRTTRTRHPIQVPRARSLLLPWKNGDLRVSQGKCGELLDASDSCRCVCFSPLRLLLRQRAPPRLRLPALSASVA